MAEPVGLPRPVREHLVLALDVADLDAATALARRLKPWFAVVKVGLELYVAEGPTAVAAFTGEGFDVFVDLKLHDIPTTVRRAARAIARTGARYATVHAAGGADMLAAAADGFSRAPVRVGMYRRSGSPLPCSRVTPRRRARSSSNGPRSPAPPASVASSARWRGSAAVHATVPGMITVVPGMRPSGVARDDQHRAGTPRTPRAPGADLLVIGRGEAARDPRSPHGHSSKRWRRSPRRDGRRIATVVASGLGVDDAETVVKWGAPR